jgi:hypothetical protein
MYKDRHREKFKKVMRHIKLINMNRRLFWIYFEVVQGEVHEHHNSHVPQVQGQAHGEVQEGHEAHEIDQHKKEIVLDALRSA